MGVFASFEVMYRAHKIFFDFFSFFFEEIFCEKRNASTPLSNDPRSFRLPFECSVI